MDLSKYLLLVLTTVLSRSLGSDIVGGDVVEPHSLPYQVSLQLTDYDNWHYCGGALVTGDLVVTAAHCCYQLDMSRVRLVAGEHDLYVEEGTEQEAGVGSFRTHEQYDPYTMENDICLIQLDRALTLGQEVDVIRRAGPNHRDAFKGQGRVSGWGDLYEGGVQPDKLMAVMVSLLSDGECKQDYGELAVTDSMLCAGDTGKDACQGDSGGPLVCSEFNDGRLDILCGLVSWGLGCGREGYPGVYTELAYFSQWIDQTRALLKDSE